MSKHTLFVYQSCHFSEEQRSTTLTSKSEHQPADGARSLNQLNALWMEQWHSHCSSTIAQIPTWQKGNRR
ncbi:MAG: hypothetical protein EDM05_004195 [Leptolyngbya sp. IPPAS B-1204]